MKRRVHLFGILAICIGASLSMMLNGCDALTKATQIDVPVEITVPIAGTGNFVPKTSSDCQDLSTNKDVMDNKDKIDGGSVSEAWILLSTVQNPVFSNPSVNMTNATFSKVSFYLTFPPEFGDTKQYKLGEFSDVKLSDLMLPGSKGKGYSIPVSSEVNAAIGLIKTRLRFCTVSTYGTFQDGTTATSTNVLGQVKFTIKFKVNTI
jgi:hypothetical protein